MVHRPRGVTRRYAMTYGFSDSHGTLIGYVQLPDMLAARSWALDWLD